MLQTYLWIFCNFIVHPSLVHVHTRVPYLMLLRLLKKWGIVVDGYFKILQAAEQERWTQLMHL